MLYSHHKISVFIFTVMSILLMACENNTLIHHYKPIPTEGWKKGDTICFHIDTVRQNNIYAFSVGLRSTAQYKYSNLWLIIESQFSNPEFARTDTIECLINDRKKENAQNGTFVHNHCYDLPPLNLQEGQTGKIIIKHYMYNDELSGLSDIGIRISI